MKWSPQQDRAMSVIAAWLRMKYSPYFYLGGYAGTGKTTLAKHIAAISDGAVVYGAFTGKAASVMASKGCTDAKTIHSMIYDVDELPEGGLLCIKKPPAIFQDVSLIIIDECSMVGEELGKDLLSYGKPVLVLGDPAQLPPINSGGYFTSKDPDFMLDEVHRQAADNPIVALATRIRSGDLSLPDTKSEQLEIGTKRSVDQQIVLDADIRLTGRHATRLNLIRWHREKYGYLRLNQPQPGEPVMCLKNDSTLGISNGQTFEIAKVIRNRTKSNVVTIAVKPDDGGKIITGLDVHEDLFVNDVQALGVPSPAPARAPSLQQFTYAHAITVHKSQGSQWPHVCVFEESGAFREARANWLYTAVTRASEKLTIIKRD